MKTVLQTITAAVMAFDAEVYKNLARHVPRIQLAVDDDMFYRLELGKCEEADGKSRLELKIDHTTVIVTRLSDRAALKAFRGAR